MPFHDLGCVERDFIRLGVVECALKSGYSLSIFSDISEKAVPLCEYCRSFEQLEPFIAITAKTCFVVLRWSDQAPEYLPIGALVVEHGKPGQSMRFQMMQYEGDGYFASKLAGGLRFN